MNGTMARRPAGSGARRSRYYALTACIAASVCAACSSSNPAPVGEGSGGASQAGAGGSSQAGGDGGAGNGGVGAGGATGGGGGAAVGGSNTGGDAGASPDAGVGGAAGALAPVGSIGAPAFAAGELDPASHGGTITFQNIGAVGWYSSRRDPATNQCDAVNTAGCCMTKYQVTTDKLTNWDQDLGMTLRGPMLVKQIAAYEPKAGDATKWSLVSAWDDRTPAAPKGVAFNGNGTDKAGFNGIIGTECLVDVTTDKPFKCGPGSVPYCTASRAFYGWAGSKVVILLASDKHAPNVPKPCSTGTTGGWYDAPWIGMSNGEMMRTGLFAGCNAYARDPAKWYLGDGAGQFNVFEVVNDNNAYTNLEVFSTNFFGYAGYVGEGPCGSKCDVTRLGPAVDLINKSTDTEAAAGAISTPAKGPGAAFRRASNGYRYFVMLFDVSSRTVQLAMIHPGNIPASVGAMLPNLPPEVPQATIDALLSLRLPK